jgi:hypothetical protein
MKDIQPLLDMYDRGASQEEVRAEAERLGISKQDLEREVAALDVFVAHEQAKSREVEAVSPLERIRLLVEEITHKN